MPRTVLITEIASYVTELYKRNQTPELVYHNLNHTEFVVKKASEIASHYSLNEDQVFVLSAAAWFHDTGQLFGQPKGHEERSVSLMKAYLLPKIEDKKIITAITNCILATKLPHNAQTLLEKILCDAGIFNFGTREFLYTDNQLKKEFKMRDNIPAIGWDRSTLDILMKHKYFTSYCKALLDKGKQENIKIVTKRIEETL